MRIVYLHQYFTVPTQAGGTRSYEFARRLVASGHVVFMITSTAMLPPPYQASRRVERFVYDGINIVAIPLKYSNSMGFAQRIYAFIMFAFKSSIEVTKHPVDVIFATSTPLTVAVPGIIGKLWHRKPLVFEVRDLWPEVPIALGALKNPLFRRLASLLEWIAYRSSKHIVALSPGMAKGISKRGIPDQRITIIPNSCDLSLFGKKSAGSDWVRERLSLTLDQPLIVYTGTFGLVNGVGYAVEIAAKMSEIDPNIHFLLVGEGKEKDEILDKAKNLNVLDRTVSIWPPLPKTELVDVLATATIATSFVIPVKELENNSANKFFDGLAAGKPVVINHEGWQKDILEESGAGISISSTDPALAARQLVEFVTDKDKLQRASESAIQLATTRFNRDILFAQFEEVIRKAL